jgi:predicted O-methyltransferase YrrM
MLLPQTDPTPIFEHFRGIHATELLTAAVAHFQVFEKLRKGPCAANELQRQLGLAERPFVVLTTALKAMGLLQSSGDTVEATPLACEHLLVGEPFDVSGYIGLAADNPSVLHMVERLRRNRPIGADDDGGAAFIFREGAASAMDQQASARMLTLSLAGRARNVAPHLAARLSARLATRLLDLGGGSGIYAYALLKAHPALRAVVFDRAEVLKVADECAAEWGVRDRVELVAGDMFEDSYPGSFDIVLLSNILHDWDVPECRKLLRRAAGAVAAGGQVVIHDVFLHDTLDGPLPIALYSAALFMLTEGRAYSGAEYRAWLTEVGLTPQPIVPTLVHCGILAGRR